MPWINTEMCTGCGVCVDECPVEAISLTDQKAGINDTECIRCGTCHDVCPEEAVRHDGERVPEQVEANLAWTRKLLGHYETPEAKRNLIKRLTKYFGPQKQVAEQTIERLGVLSRSI